MDEEDKTAKVMTLSSLFNCTSIRRSTSRFSTSTSLYNVLTKFGKKTRLELRVKLRIRKSNINGMGKTKRLPESRLENFC